MLLRNFESAHMSEKTIKTVAIIGGGLIGESWAALFAAHGVDVRVYDPSVDIRSSFKEKVSAKLADLSQPAVGTLGDIDIFDTQERAIQSADFIQENAPERPDLKQRMFREFEEQAPMHAIFASSTSSLMWSDFTAVMAAPERAIVAHPFNPPHLLPLVEIYGVDDGVVKRAWAFYERLGYSPIRIRKEAPGHVANRLSSALFQEAVHIVAEGIADAGDVDKALKVGPGLRWAAIGVFLGYHLGGGSGGIRHYLDHLGPSQEARWASLGRPTLSAAVRETIASEVEAMVDGASIADLEAQRDARLVALRGQ